ncbi:MAG: hypothetical protein OXG98_19050, partial [Gemmatimonadetes bacterium]|nr:hypothetical protein [Gemmatimonadota bacterium]
ISGLSGAAAKSATLAWFGGGSIASGGGGVAIGSAVLGGVVAVPATLVTGFFIGNKVQKVKTEVEKKKSEMDIAQAQMVQQIDVTEIALKRIDELYDSIEKTEQALETLVTNGDPANLDDLYRVAQTAKTLGELLDVVITDKNGKLIVDHNQ